MNANRTVSLLGGIAASFMLVTSAQANCEMDTVGHMYFSYAKQISLEDSPAEAFKAVKTELEALAESEKVENFAITSSDVSVGAGGYNRGLSLHISIGVQMAPNADVMDVFFRETKPESFSYSESICVSYESEEDEQQTASEG